MWRLWHSRCWQNPSTRHLQRTSSKHMEITCVRAQIPLQLEMVVPLPLWSPYVLEMFAVKASRWLPPLLLTCPLVPVRVLLPRAILMAALVRPQALNTNARGAAISPVIQKRLTAKHLIWNGITLTFKMSRLWRYRYWTFWERLSLDISNVKVMAFQMLDLFGTS